MNSLDTNASGRWLVLVGAVLSAACTDISSADLKTQGMSAHITVVADGTGATTSTAVLNVDTNGTDFVQLVAGDALATTVATQTEPMAAANVGGIITYSAGFTGQDAMGTQYTVAFTRAAGNASAPSSTASIPGPFTMGALAAQTFSRANDVVAITYSPSGQSDAMSWSIGGNCVDVLAGGILSGDPGTFTIAKGALVNTVQGAPQNCQATVTLSRTRPGTLDPAYGGGSINGIQQRTVTFTSTP